ncbi:MAG: MarR family transcriptional regulator [Sporomusaceae bacterium]|nr:MarR family transcriptional regulator [Sporomusaceae bacterium]
MVKLDSPVLREVGALARCIQSISDIRFRDLNLQRGQFVFLTRICENPGIHFAELSQILKVDKATTTKAVQKLMKEGYVERRRDEQDKRIWHLYPSEAALKNYPLIMAEENQHIASCFNGFTKAEEELVCLLLARMRQNIEVDWLHLKCGKE